jgi:tetratricopeptide (TPR) repeat protein
MAALGGYFGVGWLVGAGLVVAVVGGTVRLLLVRGKAGTEANIEALERRRLTRVPVAGLGEVEPTKVGVDAAPNQSILPGGKIPQYVPRNVDGALDDAVMRAFDGSGPWIVVAVGSSKVGKSRALFEALRRYSTKGELEFIAPVDQNALDALLLPGEMSGLAKQDRIVVWLDDLEPFINKGMTIETLRGWRERFGRCVFVGTFGGKGSSLVAGSGEGALGTIASEVLQHSCEIAMGVTTEDEIEPLRANLSGKALALLERHGLAAYLVAGPELLRKLTTRRHEPGDAECPEGVAIVYAAVDWARCGRTDPISEDVLRKVWLDYMPVGARPTDDNFESALEWALRPVAGSIALLEYVDSYRAYDYVIRLVTSLPEAQVHRDSIWRYALDGVGNAEAFSVGVAAFDRGRLGDAISAFRIAASSSVAMVAGVSTFNLGVIYGSQGRTEEAIASYEEVDARFGEAEEPVLREAVAKSLVNKGARLSKSGRSEEALAVYDEVDERFAGASQLALRDQVAKALVNKGVALGRLERPDEAIAVFSEVEARFGSATEPLLRQQVAKAWANKGVAFAKSDRPKEAITAYDEVIARFGDAAELREQVAMALVDRGMVSAGSERPQEALASVEEVLVRFGDAEEPGLREQVARALINKASLLDRSDRSEEEIATYDELVRRFGSAEEPTLRMRVAVALLNKGITLQELERPEEAIPVFDAVIVEFGGAEDPTLHEQVARALVSKGTSLAAIKRFKEALAVFAEVETRFGEATEPVLREVLARALVMRGGALASVDRREEAKEVYEAVVKRFGDDEDVALRQWVSAAQQALSKLGV